MEQWVKYIKDIKLIIMNTINNNTAALDRLLNECASLSIVQGLFPGREEMRALAEICRNPQARIGFVDLEKDHNIRISQEISEYLSETKSWNTSLFDIDVCFVQLLAIFQSTLWEHSVPPVSGSKADEFWSLVKLFFKINSDFFPRLLDRPANPDWLRVKKLGEASREELVDAEYLRSVIRLNLSDSRYAVISFQILLFFDLSIIATELIFKRGGAGSSTVRRSLAAFILRTLPLVIGSYKFGDRNGLLRDIAFKELAPKEWARTLEEIRRAVPSSKWQGRVRQCLIKIAKDLGLTVSISGREKKIFSTFLKSMAYGEQVSGLWDLYGYRVIIAHENPDTCLDFAERILFSLKRWGDSRGYSDYITSPKDNGYQSIHVVLESAQGDLVEVQIRTVRMNYVAEFGAAAHQVYKTKKHLLDEDETLSVKAGRIHLERCLSEKGLNINDFVKYLGNSLEYVPISHYYEMIGNEKYDVASAIAIMESRRNRS